MEEMVRIVLSSCPILFGEPGVALLLRVARLDWHDFWMKRTEGSISLSIVSTVSERNLLISERSKSVQNSSVRACNPSGSPCLAEASHLKTSRLQGVSGNPLLGFASLESHYSRATKYEKQATNQEAGPPRAAK